MKRSLIALTLSAALLCGGIPAASAVNVDEAFPATRAYPGFSDVKTDAWYAGELTLCYEIGFMSGNGDTFAPNAPLRVNELANLAANVYTTLHGSKPTEPKPGEPWYQCYIDWLAGMGVEMPANVTAPANRGDLVEFLSAVVPGEFLSPINSITKLPDTSDPKVLAFYNAGLLTGADSYGTFGADASLYRCETAALVARIARTDLRKSYQPKDWNIMLAAKAQPKDAYFVRADGSAVTADAYLTAVTDLIAALEADCARAGIEFNWNNTVDGVAFLKHVKDGALSACGVAAKEGTDAFRNFDVQAFYAELFELRGFKPL